MSFESRLGLLAALFAAASGLELLFKGRAASRWKEYLFLMGCGAAGALFGVANDLVTARISPEYFILGKGVPEGPGFLTGVIRVGIEAGFGGGAVGGCVLLYANRSHRRLARHVPGLILAAAAGGLAGWAGCRVAGLSAFDTVWGTHLGLYAGFAAGLVRAGFRIRSKGP